MLINIYSMKLHNYILLDYIKKNNINIDSNLIICQDFPTIYDGRYIDLLRNVSIMIKLTNIKLELLSLCYLFFHIINKYIDNGLHNNHGHILFLFGILKIWDVGMKKDLKKIWNGNETYIFIKSIIGRIEHLLKL